MNTDIKKIIFSYIENQNKNINNSILEINNNKLDLIKDILFIKTEIIEYLEMDNDQEVPYYILSDYRGLIDYLTENVILFGLVDNKVLNNFYIHHY